MPDTAPPADGAALTSSYLQTMVREQLVRTCTSSTRPAAIEGMMFYETDTDRVYMYDGVGYIIMHEPIQTFTPAFSNTTTGNGTKLGRSRRSGGWVDFTAAFTLGTTSAVSGAVVLTLPYAAKLIDYAGDLTVVLQDAGSATYTGMTSNVTAAGTALTLYVINSAGTYSAAANISSTVPMTWGTTDVLAVAGRYEMNTIYL